MRRQRDIAAAIASRQHGSVTREQLLAAGIGAACVDRWLAGGYLRLLHRGVYAVGHTTPSVDAAYTAAVLACGTGAVLSHRAAAFKLGLLGRRPPPAHVTVPTTAGLRRPGIFIHRVRVLHHRDTATWGTLPITTVARVLLDVAPTTRVQDLARVCHEAWVRHRVGPVQIEACIARNPHKPGAAKLRRALGTDVTLSKLEDAFLELLATHGLPPPRTNIDRAGDKVDCHWPHLDLTIELLSFRYHGTRQAFENDVARRRRSTHLAYTWGDVVDRGARTAAELRPLLLPYEDSACAPS